jgi:hypothetical protein
MVEDDILRQITIICRLDRAGPDIDDVALVDGRDDDPQRLVRLLDLGTMVPVNALTNAFASFSVSDASSAAARTVMRSRWWDWPCEPLGSMAIGSDEPRRSREAPQK